MTVSNLASALGRVPSGVYILTIRGPAPLDGESPAADRTTGMLASWVMQAGFHAPMVTVAVKHGRYIADWLTAGQPFNLNILSKEQRPLLKHFAHGFAPGEPAFEGLSLRYCPRGLPILPDVVAYLECEPASHFDTDDHRLFLAHVVGGERYTDEPPMHHVRNNGMHY